MILAHLSIINFILFLLTIKQNEESYVSQKLRTIQFKRSYVEMDDQG